MLIIAKQSLRDKKVEMPYLPWNAPYAKIDDKPVYPEIRQGTDEFPVFYAPQDNNLRTTLDPYNINMYLDYGPMSVYDDDRTIEPEER